MDTTPNPSRKTLLIGIGAAFCLIIIISLIAFAISGSTKHDTPKSSADSSSEEPVATKEEVAENIKSLETTIKQSDSDNAAAKEALQDSKRIQVAN